MIKFAYLGAATMGAALLVCSSGCSRPAPAPVGVVPSHGVTSAGGQQSASVVDGLLENVEVVAELPNVSGYDRSCSPGRGCVFGPAWTDTEHAGCDARNRVLAKQLQRVEFKEGTRNCKAIAGVLHDPYSGNDLTFGAGRTADIEIDHVFALARAWDAGAADWPHDRRVQFANDTANLLAVSGVENSRKSDSGPGTWMPPNQVFDCEYVTIYLQVAVKYGLSITNADRMAATGAC